MKIENLPIYFGQFLKKTRTEKGLSQESLAFLTGLDRTYISLLERAKRQPSLKTIFILAEAFGMSPALLMHKICIIGDQDESNPY